MRNIIDKFLVNLRMNGESKNTYKSRPKNSFVPSYKGILPYDVLKEFINDIASESSRIKDFAQTDIGLVDISAVGIMEAI